jgi:nitrous oxide reductase
MIVPRVPMFNGRTGTGWGLVECAYKSMCGKGLMVARSVSLKTPG